MLCADVQDELVSFHFATCDQSQRERLREHLRGCSACVQAYLDLKLDIESAEAMAEAPSENCERRLRRDVQAWLLPPPEPAPPPSLWARYGQPIWAWLAQPMPWGRTAVGVALGSAVGVLLITQGPWWATRLGAAGDGTESTAPVARPVRHAPDDAMLGCQIDSARMQAISITYY